MVCSLASVSPCAAPSATDNDPSLAQGLLGTESDALGNVGLAMLAVGLAWLGYALATSGSERRITTATASAPMPAPTV